MNALKKAQEKDEADRVSFPAPPGDDQWTPRMWMTREDISGPLVQFPGEEASNEVLLENGWLNRDQNPLFISTTTSSLK